MNLVLVESNTSGTGRLFAHRARELGYRPVLLSADPTRYEYVREDRIDVIQAPTHDEQHLAAVCREMLAAPGIAGVTSSSEYFISTAAILARALGLPGPDPEALHRCRDKGLQRAALRAHGVPVPRYRTAESYDEVAAAVAALGVPVVVKPAQGSGSIGVRLCASAEEALAHASQVLATSVNERGMAIPRKVLIEAVAEGPELSVEVLGGRAIGVTRKHLGPLPTFVEIGHDYPADLDDESDARLRAVATDACLALGLDWGPAHVELRMGAQGPVLIEVNPRLAGGFIPELVRLATGVDLIAALLGLATGQVPALAAQHRRHAALRSILAPRDGTLAAVGGCAAAAEVPHVVDVALYRRRGDVLKLRGDFRDRIGHVIACADAATAATEAASTALRLIQVEMSAAQDGEPPR